MKAENVGVPKGVFEQGKKCADPASHDMGNGANNNAKGRKPSKPFKRIGKSGFHGYGGNDGMQK